MNRVRHMIGPVLASDQSGSSAPARSRQSPAPTGRPEPGRHGSCRTDQYGLATDSTNWRTAMSGWACSVRIMVASASQKPIFVAVATANAINPSPRFAAKSLRRAPGRIR